MEGALTPSIPMLLLLAAACGGSTAHPPEGPEEQSAQAASVRDASATPSQPSSQSEEEERPPLGTLVGEPVAVSREEAGEGACWNERRCRAEGETCVTEEQQANACGPAACREMNAGRECQDSSSCYERMSCLVTEPSPIFTSRGRGPYPQCRPTPCESAADCRSDNLECVGGACQHRECRSSRQCDGYCVSGLCRAAPGRCVERQSLRHP
jgi:hypothetical protein